MSAMRPGAAAIAVALVVGGCGGTPPPVVAPVTSPSATRSAAPTATAAAASPTPSPAAQPSPLSSANGAILVREPLAGTVVKSPFVIAGDASVFEGTVAWRVVTAGGQVLAQGNTQATVGAPAKGTFKAEIPFATPLYGEAGFVEVFERSPKDGSIAQIVRVPVSIAGTY